MSEQRAFRGVWIPAEIWLNETLSLQEKVMLVEIDSLQDPVRGCYKSNRAFGKFFQLSPNRISEIVSSLAKKGWIRVQQVRQGKEVVERRLFMAVPLTAAPMGDRDPEGGIRNPEGGYSENEANPIRDPEGGYSENREERGSGLRGSLSLSGAGEEGSPVEPEPTPAPTVFERAAQQYDDGTPPPTTPRRYPMTLDWVPDEGDLAVACFRAGLAQNIKPSAAQLAKFTAHHADSAREYGTTAWLAKLVDWLRNDLRSTKNNFGGSPHANRRDRQPSRRLTAAEARQQAREQQDGGGAVYEGELAGRGR